MEPNVFSPLSWKTSRTELYQSFIHCSLLYLTVSLIFYSSLSKGEKKKIQCLFKWPFYFLVRAHCCFLFLFPFSMHISCKVSKTLSNYSQTHWSQYPWIMFQIFVPVIPVIQSSPSLHTFKGFWLNAIKI